MAVSLAPSMGDEANVRVGVRVRPLLDREVAEDARICVGHPQDNVIKIGKVRWQFWGILDVECEWGAWALHLPTDQVTCTALTHPPLPSPRQDSGHADDRTFTFDHVFPNTCTQDDVYASAVAPLVDGCFEGWVADTGQWLTPVLLLRRCPPSTQLPCIAQRVSPPQSHVLSGLSLRNLCAGEWGELVRTMSPLSPPGPCTHRYNCTIIAYGQTGSGKTYTMGSMSFAEDEAAEDQGERLGPTTRAPDCPRRIPL